MASSSSSPPPSSADHQHQYTYEVFLSFRGEDTRYTFTDHLHRALIGRGISTFRDNEELNRGEDISKELLNAIQESRVSIIVFSETYASSRWCLDELVQILECRRSRGQAVRSVFYKVDPSDVRKQTGAFGKAFAELDQCKYKDSMYKWRRALEEAANLSGWPYKDDVYEAKFIDDIVDELSAGVVNPSCLLHVTAHPVGLDSCREDVNRLLDLEESVVRMVGIWGAGGIGKTTISKEVFNSIHHKFEGSCFLADVRSNSNGLSQLQETLLCDVLGDSALRVRSVDQGVGLIMTRMQRKKALIILDDVSHSSQLEKLVPSHNCFGPGSRILITTRDRGCLRVVDEVYEVKTLNDCQAMNLFSLNAFRTIGPPSDYLVLAERAIRYAQGLPLALIVLGSHLFRRSRDEWEDTIGSCRGDPHMDIRDVLKLSYDALGEDLKEVFLDIVCFFKGKCVVDVKPILQACYGLNSGFEQLQEKALLRIDRHWMGGMIWMHDLIEEMGEEIANPEGKPDKSTRLWRYDDIKSVLSDNTNLPNLKYLDLSKCESLRELPDFTGIPNLITLDLSECRSLVVIHHSVGSLEKLEILDLNGYNGLQKFPKITGKMDSLRELDLSKTGVKELHLSIGNLRGLKKLWLEYCKNLTTLPCSIYDLRNLEILILSGCSELVRFPRKASISPPDDDSGSLFLPKLREISLFGCHLSSADFIGDLDCLETLNNLNLSANNFVTSVPALGKFVNLESLSLSCCNRLREIPELPPNILQVEAWCCESLEGFSMLPKYSLNTVVMDMTDCHRFSECLMENILLNNQDSRFCLLFPGYMVPMWFQYYSEPPPNNYEISFEIPSKLNLENIGGVALCAVTSHCEDGGKLPHWYLCADLCADLYINGVHIHQWVAFSLNALEEHVWVCYIPLSGETKGKLLGQRPYKCRVVLVGDYSARWGVHLVCQPPNESAGESDVPNCLSRPLSVNPERKRPLTGADDYDHEQEQQEQPALAMIPSKRHCTEEERSMASINDISIISLEYSASSSTQSNLPEANLDPLPDLQLTLATPGFQ